MKNTLIFIFLSITSLVFTQHNHGSLDQSVGKFIENKGQWGSDIKFINKLPNAEVIIRSKSITYYLKDNLVYGSLMQQLHDGQINSDSNYIYDACLISIEFLNANNNLSPYGKMPSNEKRNYLIGNDSTKWGQNVKSYSTIFTDEVYRGIDFEMKQSNNSVKYEFQAEAHTSIDDIKLKISGHQGLEINDHGDLVIKNNIEDIIENKPVAYQIINGKYRNIPCDFVINEDQTVSYKVGKKYNKRHSLIIDPQLIFSTASGSTADNWGSTACLDSEGNLYSGGTIFLTSSSGNTDTIADGFPSTIGAFQSTFQGGTTDIGILKFDSSGQNLIYATYIGGNDSDVPTSIIANEKQELFILSVSGSTNFPNAVNTFSGGTGISINGFDFNNGTDIVVMKLDASGSNLIKSRYVGGKENDGNNNLLINSFFNYSTVNNYGDELRGEIIIDDNENIYVASSTNNTAAVIDKSRLFPIKNGFDTTFNGGNQDGVVFKVHYSLDSLSWSTYIGSQLDDAALSLKLDKSNNLFVTGSIGGQTEYNDSTSSSFLNNHNRFLDAYIAKINSEGDSLLAFTYLGTDGKDIGYFIELDSKNTPYVLGQTTGDYGHSSDSIYFNDKEGLFIHKISPNLDSSIFHTTIGDKTGDFKPNISPTAFLVNECGNIFISGWGGNTNYLNTQTTDMPITDNAFQPTSDGSDFYMAVFLEGMDSLLYATYYGVDGVQEHVDGGTSRFSNSGIVYQSVCAGCGNNDFILFPENSTGDYPKQTDSQNCNNGVFKFDLSSLTARISTDTTCGPLSAKFINETIGGVDYQWIWGDGSDTLVTNKDTIIHQYESPGKYQVSMIATDLTTCKRKDITYIDITVSNLLVNKSWQDTLCLDEEKIWDNYTDTNFTYNWSSNLYLSDSSSISPILTGKTSIDYIVELTDSLSCTRFDTVNIFVPSFQPNLGITTLANCEHNSTPNINLTANYTGNFTPDSLIWCINDYEVLTLENTFNYKPNAFGKHDIVVKAQSKNCLFYDSSTVQIPQINVPNIITPNGDDKNESFEIGGLETDGNWKVAIFNRWGKEIFYNEEYQNEWKATNEEAGTYFYELTAPDGSVCKGWLQVTK